MAKTKKELLEQIQELQFQNLRMQTLIASQRMRNGELSVLVQEKLPDDYEKLTPTTVPDSRYNRIYRLAMTAIRWSNTSSPSELVDIREQAQAIYNFVEEHIGSLDQPKRKRLSEEHIAKMQAGRAKKPSSHR